MESIDVRRRLASDDLIPLIAQGRAERDGQRGRQSNRILVTRVETEDRLGKLELSREDVRLVGDARIVGIAENSVGARRARDSEAGTERRVERVLEIVLEAVVSDCATEVIRPSREQSANAAGSGKIQNVGRELGQESVRIDLRPVPLTRGRPEIPEAGALSKAVSAKRV